MTSIEQDPQHEAEEYTAEQTPHAEEHTPTPSTDPLEVEADSADVAEQQVEVPHEERGEAGDEDVPEDLADEA